MTPRSLDVSEIENATSTVDGLFRRPTAVVANAVVEVEALVKFPPQGQEPSGPGAVSFLHRDRAVVAGMTAMRGSK